MVSGMNIFTKVCSVCKVEKPLLDFYTNGKRGYHSQCKVCSVKSSSKSAKNNPERVAKEQEKRNLKQYGLTLSLWKEMFDKQKGCCAICGKHQSEFKYKLSTDHCHTTGKVRELLCIVCNTDVGRYESRKEEIEAYLAKHA